MVRDHNSILYTATSLDGLIAHSEGRINWLDAIPNTDQLDPGYAIFNRLLN
ncbi:hypothetical protein [Spirosoma sp. KUDC1026]|uniref:hypothetical protein n=1 Tax=Spirosoma sp. KUDC1026 TaxID=2745947 RepID=UPI00159BB827|nr:hypothetical protein [Spirosoma sp. KUDC1026]QKZ12090.1 hypothetical protein HU175_05375 [Spirosoma sp. KUDC1026]